MARTRIVDLVETLRTQAQVIETCYDTQDFVEALDEIQSAIEANRPARRRA